MTAPASVSALLTDPEVVLAPAAQIVATGRAAVQAIPDTLPDQPLPGGVAAVVRWFFHVPQWIQIGGAVLAALVAVVLALLLWRRREPILAWLQTRETGVQVVLAALVLLVVLVGAGFGKVGWDYMQHDNDFCTGCHIMSSAFQRFTESEHAELQCHDCHQQSLYASGRQLYLWVLDRPEEIGPHAPVPNEICAECHIREDPEDTWQRISATAGHRVHLESDSAALADVMCVTCHGREVHRFVPATETCGQADCHAEETTDIVLGEMAGLQTQLHCITCHEFTAPVAETAAADTVLGELVPGRRQCLGCHEMRAVLADFQPGVEPHDAQCGACHDPHVQETPAEAAATCTEAGCHDRPEEGTAFHRGLAVGVLGECSRCHEAHTFVVEGSNCGACHADVPGAIPGPAAAGSPAPPGAPASPAGLRHAGPGRAGVVGVRGGPAAAEPRRDVDGAPSGGATVQERPFAHDDHTSVTCTECHASREAHGQVTVASGDCFACHHREVRARAADPASAACARCHREAGPGPRSVDARMRLAVWEAPRTRRVPFDHDQHAEVACGSCHTGPRLSAAGIECAACHAEHHRAEAACIACHADPPAGAHTAEVHLAACTGAGCHRAEPGGVEYADLRRTRSLCLSCHRDMADHEPGRVCVRCHLLPDRAGAGGGPRGRPHPGGAS